MKERLSDMNVTNTQGTRPASWTKEEDAKFVAILENLVLKEGKNLEEVYPVAAEALGRPEGGCKYRYTSVIRKTLTGDLKEKLVTNSPRANVGKALASVSKPANNTRSNIIVRLQQVDRDLSKIDVDIEKAKKHLEELVARKAELGGNMKRYTELLVKTAMGDEEDCEQMEMKVEETA
jgi:hypothetical protein